MSALFRTSLLLSAGLMLILFLFSFTAWSFTSYASTRQFVGDVAAQPDEAADLHDQYAAMVAGFASGGDTYTYYFRSSPIEVTKGQVAGRDEPAVISLVLDTYADQFYHGRLASGGPGPAGVLIDATGQTIYGAIAVLTAILLLVFAGTYLTYPERPLAARLRDMGAAFAGAGVVAFGVFALLPTVVRSIFWGAIVEGGADDVWNMVEPVAVGLLLRNALVALALAVALFVIGFLLARKGGATAEAPKARHL